MLTLEVGVGAIVNPAVELAEEHAELEVSLTETESPAETDWIQVEGPDCCKTPPSSHSKMGPGPPLFAVAVNVILMPAHTGGGLLGEIVTDEGALAVTVTVHVLVAVFPQASVAVQV